MIGRTTNLSPNLDSLRFIAVLSVFVSHLIPSIIYATNSTARWIFGNLGRIGVILFFFHTSFVLMSSLHRIDTEHSRYTKVILAFWIRRIFRLYPLSILCVLSVVVLHVPYSPWDVYSGADLKSIFCTLLLVENLFVCKDIYGVLWSLPLEIQMYTLLPLLYFVIRGQKRYRSVYLWLISVVIGSTLPHLNWRLGIFAFAPCFTAGVMAYDFSQGSRFRIRLPAWFWPVGTLAIIAAFVPAGLYDVMHQQWSAWLLSLLLAVLYVNVSESSPSRIHAVLHWTVDRSYGIYLFHNIVIWAVLFRFGSSFPWLRVLIIFVGVTVVPSALFYLLERPFIRFGGTIAQRVLQSNRSTERKVA